MKEKAAEYDDGAMAYSAGYDAGREDAMKEMRERLVGVRNVLAWYAPTTVTILEGQARLNFDGDTDATGPKLNFYKGENWILGDRATAALRDLDALLKDLAEQEKERV